MRFVAAAFLIVSLFLSACSITGDDDDEPSAATDAPTIVATETVEVDASTPRAARHRPRA
ncbi:MAG: hypothetical protein R2849_10180 [Thermomicrobiales bacterium]